MRGGVGRVPSLLAALLVVLRVRHSQRSCGRAPGPAHGNAGGVRCPIGQRGGSRFRRGHRAVRRAIPVDADVAVDVHRRRRRGASSRIRHRIRQISCIFRASYRLEQGHGTAGRHRPDPFPGV